MFYVEYLRVRRGLVIYAIVVAAICLIFTTSVRLAHVHLDQADLGHNSIHIPLTLLTAAAGFAALIFATITSPSLNRERDTLSLAWTRPISREQMGLSYMLVDAAGIATAFVFTLVLGCIPLLSIGMLGHVYVDPLAVGSVLLMLGITLMWYGLVQAATSWYRGRAGIVIGLSWGLFCALILFGHAQAFGPLVASIANVLNVLNPLAYLSSYHFSNGGAIEATSYLTLPESVRTALSATIGVAGCAIAIFAWKRAEA